MVLPVANTGASSQPNGEQVYANNCIACHASGVLGAPKLGVEVDWRDRRANGVDKLVSNALNGINAMPPKGGNPTLTEADMRQAVEFMLSRLDSNAAVATSPPAVAAKSTTPAVAKAVSPESKPTMRPQQSNRVNAFNRLLKPPSQRNLPPSKDGIHDPANDGTAILQHPRDAFASMPKANSGNRVDWVAALNEGELRPRFSLEDESKAPVVLDLNIIREVKGSMPDVVYPHKQHTEWLDCSNCHPSIFLPKKGANNISMASILLGEKCGVCHGKVAFPVSECRKCHSKNKPKGAGK
jgi:c(7)-type cytochrome triheme protein